MNIIIMFNFNWFLLSSSLCLNNGGDTEVLEQVEIIQELKGEKLDLYEKFVVDFAKKIQAEQVIIIAKSYQDSYLKSKKTENLLFFYQNVSLNIRGPTRQQMSQTSILIFFSCLLTASPRR